MTSYQGLHQHPNIVLLGDIHMVCMVSVTIFSYLRPERPGIIKGSKFGADPCVWWLAQRVWGCGLTWSWIMKSVISFTFSQQSLSPGSALVSVFSCSYHGQNHRKPTGRVSCGRLLGPGSIWLTVRAAQDPFEDGGLFDSSSLGVLLQDWELNPSPGIWAVRHPPATGYL